MKPILILFLIALVTGNNIKKEKIDIIVCILKNEKVREEVLNVIKSFETKDFTKIISTVFSAYFVIKENVMNCINQKNYDRCRSQCKGMLHLICKKDCYNAWCL